MIDHSINGWIEAKEPTMFLENLKDRFEGMQDADASISDNRINIDFKFVSAHFCCSFIEYINEHESEINYAHMNIRCEELDYHDPINGALVRGLIEVYDSKFYYSQVVTRFPINTFDEDALYDQMYDKLDEEHPSESENSFDDEKIPFEKPNTEKDDDLPF